MYDPESLIVIRTSEIALQRGLNAPMWILWANIITRFMIRITPLAGILAQRISPILNCNLIVRNLEQYFKEISYLEQLKKSNLKK